MDTVGYCGWDTWAKILAKTGWSTEELRDTRYDAILHLVTAADGAAEHYDYGNVARHETVEQAVERDKCLRTAYLGHNKVFVIGNQHTEGFKGKVEEVVSSVQSVLGLPNNKYRFKKFLLAPLDKTQMKKDIDNTFEATSLHDILFRNQGIIPYNSEEEKDRRFEHASLNLRHTYLRAPDNSLIFIRQKSGSRINSFDYERRYEREEERIQKRRIITAREYEELLLHQRNNKINTLEILRTSFLYDHQYFQIETFKNIKG